VATLTITILADAAKAKKALAETGDQADKLGGSALGMGSAVAAGAAAGLAGLAALGKGAWQAAEESARIGRETVRVLSSTGAVAWTSSDAISDLAQSISDKTGVDDEAIQSSENLLLTFTKVKNEVGAGNDVFDQATQATLDMSTALGTDAKGAAIQLGKALNDPLKGLTALSKAGVSFTEQQKDQIKAMVAAGDILGAQKVILAEVQKEFGGAAEAAGTPLDKLMVKLGNLQEDIGAKLIPYVQDGAQIIGDTLGPAFEKATAFVTEHESAMRSLAFVGLAGVAAALAPVVAGYAALTASTIVAKVTELTGALTYMKGAFLEVAGAQGVMAASSQAAGFFLSSFAARASILAAAVVAFTNVSEEGVHAAEHFAASVAAPVGDVNALGKAIDRLHQHTRDLVATTSHASLGDQLGAWADVVIPFHDVENSIHDLDDEVARGAEIEKQWQQQHDATAAGFDKLTEKMLGGKDAAAAMSAESVVLHGQLEAIAAQEKIDPASEEGAARLQVLYEKTKYVDAGTQAMSDSQEKFNDVTATAKDKVDAYKSSLDALVGIHITAAQAETNFSENSIRLSKTLTEARAKSGNELDVNAAKSIEQAEAINKANSAIQDNVKGAMDLANATYQETGSLDAASGSLAVNRQHLIDTMVQSGYTEEAARTYIDRLGLTPENINTQVNLDHKDAAGKLEWIDGKFVMVEQGAHGNVTLDTSQAVNALSAYERMLLDFKNRGGAAGIMGGSISNIEHRAMGGPVIGGNAYLVGERGPELFVSGTSGFIVPNGTATRAGSTVINVNVSHTGLAVDSPQLGRDVVAAIKAHEKRNGPVFA
jgi:hypothetical protein